MMRHDSQSMRFAVPSRRFGQMGVVLIAALIALVAMTLASLALVRSIDTGLSIAGNTAFKEATTAAADVATDAATIWLQSNSKPPSVRYGAAAGGGYYASWLAACDMTGNKTPTVKSDDVDWPASGSPSCGAKAVAAGLMPSGYSASYIITRMCTCDGAPGAIVCAGATANVCVGMAGVGRFHGTASYDYRGLTGAEQSLVATSSPYYRVVTRVVGPRNTTSFVETVVTLQ